ncbi:MAG: hypothetical protein HOG49_19430 [Candidatus Scalindua sp.]|jgi:predicted phosphodiesterase|nr:hypothetical protein [Candidatus Scalindua sp.]
MGIDFLVSADWHIRGDRPVCRTDDYMEAQQKKIEFISNLAGFHDCPILVAGDFGHRPMWGDRLLNWFISRNSKVERPHIIAICGQHDLPNHRLDKWEEAGVGVLSKSIENFEVAHNDFNYDNRIQIHTYPYGEKIQCFTESARKINIAMVHQMVIKSQDDKLWHDQKADHAKRLLRKFPCYDYILSGDNHQSFVVEHEGRYLINAGSLMRMSANQIGDLPSVYSVDIRKNSVERVYLPIEKDVISREHIDVAKKRDDRIDSFVNRLNESYDIDFDFEKNLEEFFTKNKVNEKTKTKIWDSLE